MVKKKKKKIEDRNAYRVIRDQLKCTMKGIARKNRGRAKG